MSVSLQMRELIYLVVRGESFYIVTMLNFTPGDNWSCTLIKDCTGSIVPMAGWSSIGTRSALGKSIEDEVRAAMSQLKGATS